MSKLVKARQQAMKYFNQANDLKFQLDKLSTQPSEKAFNKAKKKLNKARANAEKWRNKALDLDKLANAADKLPPAIADVEMEEFMGPLFTPQEVATMTKELGTVTSKLDEFVQKGLREPPSS